MKHLELPFIAALFVTFGVVTFAQSTATAPLNIIVNGIQNGEGAVMIAVFDEPSAFEAMNVQEAVALTYLPASSRSVSVTLHDLPAGSYAVASLHDENMDGDLNMNGDIPTEGYSFSAMGPSGLPPRFEDAAVRAGADAQSVLLLKYW